jgi:hypothetical protein
MRCYWDEEDIWFYFEVDADGWVTRQIELQGSELTPIAAASLDECGLGEQWLALSIDRRHGRR